MRKTPRDHLTGPSTIPSPVPSTTLHTTRAATTCRWWMRRLRPRRRRGKQRCVQHPPPRYLPHCPSSTCSLVAHTRAHAVVTYPQAAAKVAGKAKAAEQAAQESAAFQQKVLPLHMPSLHASHDVTCRHMTSHDVTCRHMTSHDVTCRHMTLHAVT